jgi:hypothetical protein
VCFIIVPLSDLGACPGHAEMICYGVGSTEAWEPRPNFLMESRGRHTSLP